MVEISRVGAIIVLLFAIIATILGPWWLAVIWWFTAVALMSGAFLVRR